MNTKLKALITGLIVGLVAFFISSLITGGTGLPFYNYLNKIIPATNVLAFILWGLIYVILFSALYCLVKIIFFSMPTLKLVIFFGLGIIVSYGLFWAMGLFAFYRGQLL